MKALVAIAAASLACSSPQPPPAPDAAACALAVSWGTRDGGAFRAFADGDDAPITRGFQGFRFIDSAARIDGTAAASVSFDAQVTLFGHDPNAQQPGRFDLTAGSDGALYADDVQIFFNDTPLPDVVGRTAAVVLVAHAGSCTAQTRSTTVHLVLGPCQPPPDGGSVLDGGFACVDGGI